MTDVTGSLPTAGSPDPDPDVPEDSRAGAVTGEWVEVYPPDGDTPRSDDAVPPRPRLAMVPTVLFAIALLLVVFASVLPLFLAGMGNEGRRDGVTFQVTPWRLVDTTVAPGQTVVTHSTATPIPFGYPLVLAGLLLLATVVLRARVTRGAHTLGVVSAAFLAGVVFALGMFEIAWQRLLLGTTAGLGIQSGIGQGFWVFLLATMLAVAGAALSFRTPRADPPAPTAWPDPPDAPASEAPTGQPPDWPVVAVIPVDERTNW